MNRAVEFVKEIEGVREFRLLNGLRVLLVPHNIGGVVAFMVHYNIGSRNEGVGYTGSTHFLEHLMFEGSKNFPKDTHPIEEMFARTGAMENATTWLDRTNYFEIVLPEHLELFMRVEADRMRNAAFSDEDRQSQMSVVRSELEMSQNDPANALEELVIATAIREHPYHHPTIGWRSDVEGVATERFREFYNTFYYPNNALIILAGSIREDKALGMIAEHFGGTEASPKPIPQVYTEEPPQEGERRVILKRPGGNGLIQFGWMVPGTSHKDFAALEVLRYILSIGEGALLKKKFVNSGRVASVHIQHFAFKDPFPFFLNIDLLRGIGHRAIEKEVRGYLGLLQKEGIDEDRIVRAKRLAEAHEWYGRDSLLGLLMNFSMAEGAGGWELYFSIPESIQTVSQGDIMRVFREYFHDDNLTVGWFVPQKAQESE